MGEAIGLGGAATDRVHIRWMVRRDVPEVLAIERASFDHPRCEEELLAVLRQRNCIGMVAEYGERIVGFMIYKLHREGFRVLDFAVHPGSRRRGVGRRMLLYLVGRLSARRRNRIAICVRDTSLDAHLFLRACGLRAVAVLRGRYADTGEDGYEFRLGLDPAASVGAGAEGGSYGHARAKGGDR